jgi:transcriptional regulator with XRE-family HTH domain
MSQQRDGDLRWKVLLLRNLAGVSREDLATAASVRRQQIGEIERGNSVPRGDTLAGIARKLSHDTGVPISSDDLISPRITVGQLVDRVRSQQTSLEVLTSTVRRAGQIGPELLGTIADTLRLGAGNLLCFCALDKENVRHAVVALEGREAFAGADRRQQNPHDRRQLCCQS